VSGENQDAPAQLYAIIDPAESDFLANVRETLAGVSYVVLDFAERAICDVCNQSGAYRLQEDPYGDAECREHLTDGQAVRAVVKTKEAGAVRGRERGDGERCRGDCR